MNLIFECWCIFLTKLKIYENKIVVSSITGTKTIPMRQIALVKRSITGKVTFETTGGDKSVQIAPWASGKRQQVVDIVSDLIE
jgi:hypothetical protein